MPDDHVAPVPGHQDHLVERAAARLRGARAAPATTASTPGPNVPPPDHLSLAALEGAGLAVVGDRSRAMEEWRIVAGSLWRNHRAGRGGHAPRLAEALMVTSTQPAEGKSFCSINLAVTLAASGLADAILVDLDSKPDCITDRFGLAAEPGILDLARDATADPAAFVRPTAIDRFSFVPLGDRAARLPRAKGATGGSVDERLIAALVRLSRAHPDRLLVLDMAPALSTSDAPALGPHVGQIAMVVEAGRTTRPELEAALGLLEACPQVTLVLNKTRADARGHFGGDHHGYYSAGSAGRR